MPMIFLHGALGSTKQFDPLLAQFPSGETMVALNFPGHGQMPSAGPFSMDLFSDSVLHGMDQAGLEQTDLFGYSMGGYIALWLAWKYPDRISKVLTYGTKLEWNPEIAGGMSRMFDAEKIEAKTPQLAESLAEFHGIDEWKRLCRNTAGFLTDLGNGAGIPSHAFAQIRCPVVVGWGDQDHVVTELESSQVVSLLPDGKLVRLPGGKHMIEQVDPAQLAAFIREQA